MLFDREGEKGQGGGKGGWVQFRCGLHGAGCCSGRPGSDEMDVTGEAKAGLHGLWHRPGHMACSCMPDRVFGAGSGCPHLCGPCKQGTVVPARQPHPPPNACVQMEAGW